jgi:ATP-dependent RNA helicase DDX19/DBP5
VIGQAPTGTGKTAAFVLGALSRCSVDNDVPQTLIVSPTRELTRQLYDVVMELGKHTGLKFQLVVPDAVGLTSPIRAHVVIGTPGKLLDTIKKRVLNLRNIRIMVLDEADLMLGMQNLCTQALRLKKQVLLCCVVGV